MSTAIEAPGASSAGPADEFISAREASRLTGIPTKKIARAAELGLLAVRRPPPGLGGVTKFGKASCLALAASMVTPARTSAIGV